MQRLEAVRLRTFPQRRECQRCSRDALEFLRAEIDKFEQFAQQFTRALGDDDAVGLSDPLEPGGQVWRVADDLTLLRLSRAQQIADDHDPGRDPHAHMQRRAGSGLQRRRSLDDGEPRPHGPLSVMLVRLRIAEIAEHAVAHVFGDEPPAALN